MDSADSQWILPLCVCAHLCMCAAHAKLRLNSSSAIGHVSVNPVFSLPSHIMSEHALPDACLWGVYANKVVKANGSYVLSVSFDVSVMSGKLITQIWLTDLTLVTSLTRLLDWLGNLRQEHTFQTYSQLLVQSQTQIWNLLRLADQTSAVAAYFRV